MYTEAWARDVQDLFRKFCPRAEQIDRVLVALLARQGLKTDIPELRVALTHALMDPQKLKQATWSRYKTLCRKTPFRELEGMKEAWRLWDQILDDRAINRQLDLF